MVKMLLNSKADVNGRNKVTSIHHITCELREISWAIPYLLKKQRVFNISGYLGPLVSHYLTKGHEQIVITKLYEHIRSQNRH